MTPTQTEVVICGAGIAGISAAYHLAVQQGLRDVVLVDERAPLTLTSDKSTECYRNWWPGPGSAMVSLMNRSIDILEALAHESDNLFHLNRRGYLYATSEPARIVDFKRTAEEAAELGAGPARYHTGAAGGPDYRPAPAHGFEEQPTGADVITDTTLIRKHFPYLTDDVVAVVHARRAGWFSAQQLGMYLLERAREHGVRFVPARVEDVDVAGGRVQSVRLSENGTSTTVATPRFVNAAGPLLKEVGQMVDVDLPIFSELHIKVALHDHLGIVPRDAPLLIWTDPTDLPWSDEERALLAGSEETRWLLETFPAGVHTRPEGGLDSDVILILWTYDIERVEPVFPVEIDPDYPEVALRGLGIMIPELSAYFDRIPQPEVDGGYYTKTQENRPLIGPLPVDGAYVIGALSGFGLMAGCAAGELLAAHVAGDELPDYAPWFDLKRYNDPEYQALVEDWDDSGQL